MDNLEDFLSSQNVRGLPVDSVNLGPEQSKLLAGLAQKINLPYIETQTSFSTDIFPARITKVADPEVDKILNEETNDRVGYILTIIHNLNIVQKIKLMLSLSDGEFEEFKKRREEGAKKLAKDISSSSIENMDRSELIRAYSRLSYCRPKYEVDAESRRKLIKQVGKYPISWDYKIGEIDEETPIPPIFLDAFK